MSTTRRRFLQVSATAATALSVRPLDAATAALTGAQTPAPAATATTAIRARERSLEQARKLPLDRVRLTGGPLKHAQDLDGAYLLSLDPDRMMAYYRVRAGLKQKAQPYGGWDGGGRNLTGHLAGHHLSAVSLMYQATGDPKFKARATYLVSEMKIVQDANKDGYLGALENGREAFNAVSKGDIKSGGFDLNGLWSPWYVLHKTFGGLRDAYRYTGNRAALDLSAKFAGWSEGILKPLTDAQVASMLNTEHGGMNEVLADLYADTGDKRWLALSRRFEHHAFTDALKRGQDNLNGKHGNCQIPKLIGSAARYGYTGDAGDLMAASFFWDRVVQHHSYASGGHGLAEYFGPPDVLGARVDGRTCESCNVYNMLKLTRRMFAYHTDPFYADFHERAIFNHILGSMDAEDGRTSYMVPVGRGVQQEYQDMERDFTCCVCSGQESHALHGDGLYYESDDALWVNLFTPSTAKFTTGGVTLATDTTFPDGDAATIKIDLPAPKALTIHVRRPYWAGDGFTIAVNGTPMPQPPIASLRAGGAGGRQTRESVPEASTFVSIARTWKSGDTIALQLPKTVRLEPTPDDPKIAAIMWGPLVLAGDWGPRREGRGGPAAAPIPVLVAADKPVADWVKPASQPAGFIASGVARVPGGASSASDVTLAPFYKMSGKRYSMYFDVLAPADFAAREAAIADEAERNAEDGSRDDRLRPTRRDAAGARLQLSERSRESPDAARRRPRLTRGHRVVLVRSAGGPGDAERGGRDVQESDRRYAGGRQLPDSGRWHRDRAIHGEPRGEGILRRHLRGAGESRAGQVEGHGALRSERQRSDCAGLRGADDSRGR